jgi:5-dehydro-4-deoxyglucarate dehydratase
MGEYSDLAARISRGLLSFPITHFGSDLAFNEHAYRAHLSWLLDHDPAGIFAAGGTGEFFSLSSGEVESVVAAAVAETNQRVPVISGVGYGRGLALELVTAAERAGADGILLLPPYLVQPDPAGLVEHIRQVCAATKLGVIVYNRDNAILDEIGVARLCDKCPNLIGLKDGVGDVELMIRIQARLGDRLIYVGGLPTAETFALPYLEMGVTTYSSAIFNFLPDFAQVFYAAVRRRDRTVVYDGLRRFVLPYIAIRNRRKGFAVSIVKAGMKAVGHPAGPVRPPLVDLDEGEISQLTVLLNEIRSRPLDVGTRHDELR